MRHLVILTETDIGKIKSGESVSLDFSFKKRESFLEKINPGDKVFFRSKKGGIDGAFSIKKIILTLTQEEFSTRLTVLIDKLEQFITSPIEVDRRVKKSWTILEN